VFGWNHDESVISRDLDQRQEAVQHIEEDLLLAIYAAKCYKLQAWRSDEIRRK
jgi:hypothetical protein